MIQKAAELRLFAFNTSQLRIHSAPSPLLLRSAEICTFAVPSAVGLSRIPWCRWFMNY